MYKIRFHLANGNNFMKWQVKNTDTNEVSYVDPSENQIAMMNATLKVQPSTAKKIHEGACKTVCAWIQCEAVQILPANRLKINAHDYRIQFNPKVDRGAGQAGITHFVFDGLRRGVEAQCFEA